MEYFFTLDQLEITAEKVLKDFPRARIFLMKGNMGAGKTTLVQGFTKALGLESLVASPTYTLVQDYSERNLRVYHMDLFRAKSVEEIWDLGFWEYLDQARFIFIEWPEIIETYLDPPFLTLELETLSSGERNLKIKESLSSGFFEPIGRF